MEAHRTNYAQIEVNAGFQRECRWLYDNWQKLVASKWGPLIMFAWAVCEATFWPIIPDFLVVPMATVNRNRFYRPLFAAIAGSALGGILMLLLASLFPAAAQNYMAHLPLVSHWEMGQAQDLLKSDGVSAFWIQPWSGAPFKVWAISAATMHLNLALVIPTFILARAFRMAVWATVARVVSGLFRNFFRDYYLFLIIFYLVFFFFGWWQVISIS